MNHKLEVAAGPGAGGTAWRNHGLRVLFALGLIWAILLGFAEELFSWMTGDPDETLWGWLVLTLVVAAGCGLTLASCLAWRKFLRIPDTVGPARVAGWLLVSALVVAVVVGIAFAAVEYRHVQQTGNPQNPQYGLSVFFAAMWYPAVLTPVLTVVATWLACRNKTGKPSP